MNDLQLRYAARKAAYEHLKARDKDSDAAWTAFEAMYRAGDDVIAWAKTQLTPKQMEHVAICFGEKAQRHPAHRARLIDICMRLRSE